MPLHSPDHFEDPFPDQPGSSVPSILFAPQRIRKSGTGRIPQWAVDEALGIRPPAARPRTRSARFLSFGAAQGSSSRKRRRPVVLRPRTVLRTAVVVAVLLCFYFGTAFIDRNVAPAVEAYLPWSSAPPQGVEAAAKPLGTPPDVADSTAYRLLEPPDSSQPFAAYDPCRPIHYVIRPDGAPQDSEALIHESVAEVSAASGLQFVYDGLTEEDPSNTRESYQPDVYGKRWAPVLIAWSSPTESPRLAGDVAGLGGSATVKETGTPYVRVNGQIELDGPDLAETLVEPYGPDRVQAVIMHELGHVLGLGHVDDPAQLMFGGPNSVTELQDGDRAGLAVLGTGACVPQL